jgi:type III secretion protein T
MDLNPQSLMTGLVLAALCSVRTVVALSVLAPLRPQVVPAMVRGALGVALVLPVIVARLHQPLPDMGSALALLSLLAREMGIGLFIGLGFGAFLAGLQAVGEIIDHQTGQTFTQNIDPVMGNNVSVTAQWFQSVVFSVLMMSGLLLLLADALYLSYQWWPIGQPLTQLDPSTVFTLVREGGLLFALAVLLAGPVILVLFAFDTGLAMLNRTAPQLNIFTIGLSLKSVLGLFVLMVGLPTLLHKTVLGLHEVANLISRLIVRG